MLGTGGSTYTWSQSDLEDLVDPPKDQAPQARVHVPAHAPTPRDTSNAPGGPGGGDDDGQTLSISLDFLKSGNNDHTDSRPPSSSSVARRDNAHLLASFAGGPASPFAGGAPTSPFAGEPASPWSEVPGSSSASVGRNTLYRRTSNLVEPSDPVVLSSSQRSSSVHRASSLSRSLSVTDGGIDGEQRTRYAQAHGSSPPDGIYSTDAPAAANPLSRPTAIPSSFRSAASNTSGASPPSSSDSSSLRNWPPEVRRYQLASTALYRSSSASRTQPSGISPGFVPWALGGSSGAGGGGGGQGNANAGDMGPHSAMQPKVEGLRIDARASSRRNQSPSRLDEHMPSPHILETMPEGVEPHHSMFTQRGNFHRTYDDQHQQQSHHHSTHPHHRVRSASSAAALGPVGGGSNDGIADRGRAEEWDAHHYAFDAYDRGAAGSDAASYTSSDSQHRPAFATWGQQSYDAGYNGIDTARQSPAERRRLANQSNFSPFRDVLAQGGESRRHSVAGEQQQQQQQQQPITGTGQRRAVGFELRDATASSTRTTSVDRAGHHPAHGHYEAETPRSRRHAGAGGTAFSEDDLAADLGQLQVELDRISAERERSESRGPGSCVGVNVRVPSSQAAAVGAHAASMPPMFGGGAGGAGERTGSFSASEWNAILSPHSPSEERWGEFLGHGHGHGHAHFGQGLTSKSRSASVGPRQYSPPDIDVMRGRRLTESVAGGAGDVARRLGESPASSASVDFELGQQQRQRSCSAMQHQARVFQPAHAPPQHHAPAQGYPPPMRAGSGLLPGSLKSPSAAGAVQSGVTASASAFSLHAPASAYNAGSGGGGGPPQPAGVPAPAPAPAPSQGQLHDYAMNSLATLGPLPPSAPGGGHGGHGGHHHGGAGGAGSGAGVAYDSPASLAELGRGVPLASLPRDTPLYVVGFKQGRTDLFFRVPEGGQAGGGGGGGGGGAPIRKDDLVIVEADRGKDVGRVVNDSITVDQVRAFLAMEGGGSDGRASAPAAGSGGGGGGAATTSATAPPRAINPKRLYGLASPSDLSLLSSKSLDEERALAMCTSKVQQRALPMHVLAAELQWDRRKMTFYYTAASRVDFRALVAELFKVFKMRIWMCQVGAGAAGAAGAAGGGGGPPAGPAQGAQGGPPSGEYHPHGPSHPHPHSHAQHHPHPHPHPHGHGHGQHHPGQFHPPPPPPQQQHTRQFSAQGAPPHLQPQQGQGVAQAQAHGGP